MTDKIQTGLWKKDGKNGTYYSGSLEIAGVEYWVNLYRNDRKSSDKSPDLNLVLKPKEEKGNKQTKAPKDELEDDDLPF